MQLENKAPFFSAVIPVYNKGPHVARAIRSVLAQTWQDYELLLINDASTDESLEEMQKFTDPRIRILHRDTPGPGGYAARNLGIREAKAEWVAFLDADDEWYPEHLGRMYVLANKFKNCGVMGSGYQINEGDTDLKEKFRVDPYFLKNKMKECHFLSFQDFLQTEIKGKRPIWTSVACIKKNVFDAAGGFPEGKANRGGDVDTWLRCIEKSRGMAWSPHVGAIYHRDSVNMVTRSELSFRRAEPDTVKSLLNFHKGVTAKMLKQFVNKRIISAWRYNRRQGEKTSLQLRGNLYWSVIGISDMKNIIVGYLPNYITLVFRKAKVPNWPF